MNNDITNIKGFNKSQNLDKIFNEFHMKINI